MTLNEIADRIRKEVESLAQPNENWTVTGGQRIWLNLSSQKNPTQNCSAEINASNCDDVSSVVEFLRSNLEAQARKDEEYAKALLEKCKPEA